MLGHPLGKAPHFPTFSPKYPAKRIKENHSSCFSQGQVETCWNHVELPCSWDKFSICFGHEPLLGSLSRDAPDYTYSFQSAPLCRNRGNIIQDHTRTWATLPTNSATTATHNQIGTRKASPWCISSCNGKGEVRMQNSSPRIQQKHSARREQPSGTWGPRSTLAHRLLVIHWAYQQVGLKLQAPFRPKGPHHAPHTRPTVCRTSTYYAWTSSG